MASSVSSWTLRPEGSGATLKLQGELPRAFRADSVWRQGLAASDVSVLLREGSPATGYMAGTLGTLALGEIFGHLLAGVRSGRLVVSAGAVQRQVVLRDGQVIFATSTERHERLGWAVVQLGLLTQDQVEEALLAVKPGERLGLILTRTELLSAAEVYAAMTFLVREIVVNLFEVTSGEFCFLELDPPMADAVKLSERTRDLVLEGIRRSEEVHRLRRRWPDSTHVARGPKLPEVGGALDPLWAAVGGGSALEALRQGWDGGEYSFLVHLDALMTFGALTERHETAPSAPEPAPPPSGVLQMYQDFLQQVSQALLDAGLGLDALRAYLQEPGPKLKPLFEGALLSDEGILDVERIQANVAANRDEDAGDADEPLERAQTYEALEAFLAYALFSAQNVLPVERFLPLQKQAQAMRGER